MELETILSKDIRAANLRAAYDAACKRLPWQCRGSNRYERSEYENALKIKE